MKEHVEAGFARIFADDVRGRQVEEGRSQLGADGVHLEMVDVNEVYGSTIKYCHSVWNMFLLPSPSSHA